jgi:hypothetical protein
MFLARSICSLDVDFLDKAQPLTTLPYHPLNQLLHKLTSTLHQQLLFWRQPLPFLHYNLPFLKHNLIRTVAKMLKIAPYSPRAACGLRAKWLKRP